MFSDGTVGAHILDYLRYVLNPLKKRVPFAVEKFMALLQSAGVPESVYNASLVLPLFDKKSQWLTFQ